MKVAVLSDGGWGTALALLLHDKGRDVVLWGPFGEYVAEMAERRENVKFLPAVPLPQTLPLTGDLQAAVTGADVLVLAAPTKYMRSLLEHLATLRIDRNAVLLNVAKGIELGTLKRVSQMVEEMIGPVRYAVLSGPSHAEEVARKIPTAVVTASAEAEAAELIQACFMTDCFRVYTSDDPVGLELGGALKNVLALAAGVCDGMGFGDNTKAALMTRGIVEMARLGQTLGGRGETFSGLSGIGDLIVTCMSRHSRNRHVGQELGKGRKLDEIIEQMAGQVAEGVTTAKSAYQLARQHQVETPIIDQVYAGLYLGKDPRTALRELMTREAKAEQSA